MLTRTSIACGGLLLLAFGATSATRAQQPEALRLVQTIVLPTSAIFDHVAVDRVRHRAYVAASANRSVEIVDLKTGTSVKTIKGVGKPAGMLYHPKMDRVVYSVDSGHLRFLNPNTFEVETEITLAGDADCMKWDTRADVVYVVNGGSAIEEDYVRLTAIDLRGRRVLNELNIPGDKLEFIAVEARGPRLFVNNVARDKVTVVDRDRHKVIGNWDLPGKEPYPMLLNEGQHRLYVVTRDPALLVVFDTNTGKIVAQHPAAEGCDDIWYDVVPKRLYLSCGTAGVVDVFQQNGPDNYVRLAQVRTRLGARTSAWVQEEGRLYVPVPTKQAGQPSELRVFESVR